MPVLFIGMRIALINITGEFMAKNKTIITEEEFNRRTNTSWKHPEADSPGDSERDSVSEIEMGFNYGPKEELEYDDNENEVNDPFKKFESAPAKGATKEIVSGEKVQKGTELPDSAKVVASDLPSHRQDREGRSDTH